MKRPLVVVSIVAGALGVAACGSSSKTSAPTPSTPASASTSSTTSSGAVASRTYSVKMTGSVETPAGAPHGTGDAVVTIRAKTSQVCWTFTNLAGFTHPAAAHIHHGAAGVAGPIVVPLSTGAHFLTKGCVHASASLIQAIEKAPSAYYVNVHSKSYPDGAVRAQL